MATLRYFPSSGAPQAWPLHKPVSTIGRALGCDVSVRDATLLNHHAQIVFNGRDFQLEEVDKSAAIAINGKKKRRARLINGDRLVLGDAQFSFSMFSELGSSSSQGEAEESNEIAGFRRLHEFSERLMLSQNLDELLDGLLDSVLELTGAARGLVLLIDGADAGKLEVKASRNIKSHDLVDTVDGGVSDSIVRQVVETKRPIIVSDALTDTTFSQSESVMALRLSSVMCAPLLNRGEVIGALYVANDEIKSLFERRQLDVLTVFAGQASLLLTNTMLLTALRADNEKLESELGQKRFGEIIGSCASMMEVFRKLQKVASTDISVLITGETGTGKELIAREIHRRSDRPDGNFVTVNCGAIPENLMESEMFGHVKGAFTGAVTSRGGRFQSADGGTLFLDEIGELSLQLQVKLLRALQERTVTRVGDSRAEKVDIRVVAATNRNLEEMIQEGLFREDLYYRLNVVNLWLPPLRERGDDVFIIAKALLSKYADELKSPVKGFSPSALSAVKKYSWPGNIRQLENRIKKALVLCDKSLLGNDDLDLGEDTADPLLPLERAKEEFQRKYVLSALERNNGNRTQTARDLGVDPRTIFRYLERGKDG